MRTLIMPLLVLTLVLSGSAQSQTSRVLPDNPAPQPKSESEPQSERGRILDKRFLALTALTGAALAFDGYTTSWIRPRWLQTPTTVYRPCEREAGEPLLFGREPTVGRSCSCRR